MRRVWLASLVAVAFAALVGVPGSASGATFSNPAPIVIPESGAANPYPSNMTVSGLPGAVTRVRATLSGVSHTFPSDINTLLVAPGGQRTILMSAVCGRDDNPATGQTFTFEDAAPGPMPEQAEFCPSGTYKPTKGPIDPGFPPPAPAGPQTVTAMSALNGSPANGTWELFAFDPAAPDAGVIAGGWSLDLLTDATCSGRPATLTGTAGDEELVGTEGDDVILGFGGSDTILGLGGRDVICGGDAKDTLRGGSGKDKVVGQGGKDKVLGNGGKDKLLGKGGPDKLNGGPGKDVCKGGKKDDAAKKCEVEKSI